MIKNFIGKLTPKIECDVLVVGAGPAGAGAAKAAAKAGANVVVIDKKKTIGSPVECGEAVGVSLLKEFNIKINPKAINAKQDGTVFWINKKIRIENTSPLWKSISVNRNILDKSFAEEAALAGANLLVGAELIDAETSGDDITVVTVKTDRREIIIKPKVVVAADGTFSTVGKFHDRRNLHKNEIARSVSYEMTNLKLKYPNMIQMFFDDLTGVGYGYIIPKSKKSANIGLGRLGIDEHPWEHLENFIELHPIVEPQIRESSILEVKVGETPITGPKLELVKGNVLYVGDAAGQNLSHVGEGAIPSHICGLIAGEVAANAIIKKETAGLSRYPQRIKKTIGPLFNETASIRDNVLDILNSDIETEKKYLLGALLVGELLNVKNESEIETIMNLSESDEIPLSILRDIKSSYIHSHKAHQQ